ncbi:MAG: HAD-IA family hydrolase [Actinomycetes bacterium]
MFKAVFFDFGGVILSSPFDAFLAYETRNNLPVGTLRSINSQNPNSNAWARLERGELSIETFVREFEFEAAALGYAVDGLQVLSCLSGEIRPEMVQAVRRCQEQLGTALLTNNFVAASPHWSSGGSFAALLPLFDAVIESSTAGCRKPESRFYEIALERMRVEPDQVVFLDDLGINLKPARKLGMTTIKVIDPSVALAELELLLGFHLGHGEEPNS